MTYTPHPGDVTAAATAMAKPWAHVDGCPTDEESVQAVLAAVGPAIERRALLDAADVLAADPLWGEQWPTQWLRARAKQVGE